MEQANACVQCADADGNVGSFAYVGDPLPRKGRRISPCFADTTEFHRWMILNDWRYTGPLSFAIERD